jgi:hypothetical protein
LWRADKNSLLIKKSKWSKVLLIYIVVWLCFEWFLSDQFRRLVQRPYDRNYFMPRD